MKSRKLQLHFWIVLSLVLVSTSLQAQNIKVSGKVNDGETNEVLPGVNIVVKGTTIGIFTDSKGSFDLEVPSLQDTLVFSFVGYQSRQIPLNGRTKLAVSLRSKSLQGKEMVVVGYGQQKRITTTGAISSVSMDDVNRVPTSSLGNALTGKVAGLTTIQTTGQPGLTDPNLFIRGVSTFNNVSPLVVIDGIPSTLEELEQLDPSSITKLSVLKDASATAVYGVRGANGVIIAKTKRGKGGTMKISANLSTGLRVPSDYLDFTDAYGFARAHNRAAYNDGSRADFLPKQIVDAWRTGSDPLIYPNINWWDKFINNAALQTKDNFNITGGTNKARYFLSLGYLRQGSIFNTDFGGPAKTYSFKYQRFNINANVDLDLSPSSHLKLTSRGKITKRREPRADGTGGNFWSNRVVGHSIPYGVAGIHEGKFVQTNPNYYPFNIQKTVFELFYGQGYRDYSRNNFDISLNYQQQLNSLVEGLEFDAKVNYGSGYSGISILNGDNFPEYFPVYKKDAPFNSSAGADSNDVVFKKTGSFQPNKWSGSYGVSRKIYWQGSLRYSHNFGKHQVGGLLLYNQSKNYYPGGNSYPNIPTGYVGSAFRATYNYDEKYLAEIDLGYNGSENFAKDKRFGFFPAFSAGWVVTNENFADDLPVLDYLKLRASWGRVGNDRTGGGRFLYLPDQYSRLSSKFQGYNFGVNIPNFYKGATVAQIGNPNISWETSTKKDIGIETRFLNDRLQLTFDYFEEDRRDILLSQNSIPAFVSTPLNLPPVNLGKVNNKGYEIEFGWNDNADPFSYHIKGNWSYAHNKIIAFDEVPPNFPYQSRTGRPLGQQFGYVVNGFYTQDKIDEGTLPQNGLISNPMPGDVLYKDVNQDGIINANDQTHIGYPNIPQVTYGGEIGFSYKGFDVKTVWQGVSQVSRRLSSYYQRSDLNNGPVLQWHLNKSWTQTRAANGEKNLLPRLSQLHNDYNYFTSSTMWVRNASYIRMKNAVIGYTLPNSITQNLGLSNLRFYLNGYNLLTITNPEYKALDPEQTRGRGSNLYPIVKIFNLGIDVDF